MLAKELLEARWKIVVGAVVLLGSAAAVPLLYSWVVSVSAPEDLGQLGDFRTYIGSQWFGQSSAVILSLLAIILGAGQIAGEVSKGSIFFLLSRPLSRRQIFGYKYGVSALVLLALLIAGSSLVYGLALSEGEALNLWGMLLSTLLSWLGVLSVLGLALLFSVLLSEPLRALLATIGASALILFGPPAVGGPAWNIAAYWFNLETFQRGHFPAIELLVCVAAALVPLALAISAFERRSY